MCFQEMEPFGFLRRVFRLSCVLREKGRIEEGLTPLQIVYQRRVKDRASNPHERDAQVWQVPKNGIVAVGVRFDAMECVVHYQTHQLLLYKLKTFDTFCVGLIT